MNFSPAKCYKDLMVEFLDAAVGGMSCFPGYEDYHREYLEDYDIESLEELVKKFSKKGHTYFAFMAGMVYSTCMDKWSDELDNLNNLSDEENDEFIEVANAGLTSFMTLLGVEEISMEEMFDILDLDSDDCDCEECDCDESECNCCDKHCGNCDCKSCSDSFNVEDDCIDENKDLE